LMDWLRSWAVDAWIGCRSYCPATSSVSCSAVSVQWRRPMDMGVLTGAVDQQESSRINCSLHHNPSSSFCATASFAITPSPVLAPAMHGSTFPQRFQYSHLHECTTRMQAEDRVGLISESLLVQSRVHSPAPRGWFRDS
jgi:hypothetical protein